MKKICYFILLFALIGSNYSFADCMTGYACSINSLQAKNFEIEQQFLKELNEYFDLKINEDFMLKTTNKNFKYKDFFPFSVLLE